MDLITIARKRAQAWNRHDVAAVVASYTTTASSFYCGFGAGLNPVAMGVYVEALWEAYPDAAVEIKNIGEIAKGQVGMEWILRGKNSGYLPNNTPPTGRSIIVYGVSIIQFQGHKISSERIYFDRQSLLEQLGFTKAKETPGN